MQGTLKQLRDNFGFFETADGDVFVQRRDLPNDARNGDVFEFETEDRGGRNPVAINLNRLGRGAPGGERARGRDRPEPRDRGARDPKLGVTWDFDDPDLQTYGEGDATIKMLEVPIVITVIPKRGQQLTLKANGQPVRDPEEVVTVDNDGQVLYVLGLEEHAKQAVLSLIVREGDRVTGTFTKRWKKCKEDTKPVAHLEVHEHPASEGKILRTLMTHEDKPIAGKISVESVAGSVLDVNVTGTSDLKTGFKLEFDSDGSLSLHVRIKSLPVGHFGGDHVIVKVTDTKLEFKPIHIPYYV